MYNRENSGWGKGGGLGLLPPAAFLSPIQPATHHPQLPTVSAPTTYHQMLIHLYSLPRAQHMEAQSLMAHTASTVLLIGQAGDTISMCSMSRKKSSPSQSQAAGGGEGKRTSREGAGGCCESDWPQPRFTARVRATAAACSAPPRCIHI